MELMSLLETPEEMDLVMLSMGGADARATNAYDNDERRRGREESDRGG